MPSSARSKGPNKICVHSFVAIQLTNAAYWAGYDGTHKNQTSTQRGIHTCFNKCSDTLKCLEMDQVNYRSCQRMRLSDLQQTWGSLLQPIKQEMSYK